ncbi:hypothetical protein LguiA_009175 [Lonicera macranthoides]
MAFFTLLPLYCLDLPLIQRHAEVLQPAIDGTLNVLHSCKKNPSLKRVVLTSSSSTARVKEDFDPNVPLDESSWTSLELCERLKLWYALSKTLAEKAAWDFCKENNINLVTVLPSFIVGPSLPLDLCSTANDVLDLLKGAIEKFYWYGRMGYVHIDDVARCHILVYEHENAHGRYLCSSTVIDNNELVSILTARYPALPIPKRFEVLDRPYYEFNTAKLTSLGFKFKTIEEILMGLASRGLVANRLKESDIVRDSTQRPSEFNFCDNYLLSHMQLSKKHQVRIEQVIQEKR